MGRATSPKSLISPLGRPRLFPLSTTWLNGSLFTFRSRLYFIIYYYLLILLILILVLTLPRIVAPVFRGCRVIQRSQTPVRDTTRRSHLQGQLKPPFISASCITSPSISSCQTHLSCFTHLRHHTIGSPSFTSQKLCHSQVVGSASAHSCARRWMCRKEVIVVRHKVQSPSFLTRVGSVTLLFSFTSI